jgi:tRNA pseudouridine38-40 synthase
MSVIRLLIAYDGTGFHGWARQPGVRTVQGALEDAVAALLDGAPRLAVAGRTDAGVHAWGQVASFVAPRNVDPESVLAASNARLAPEVVIREARRAPDGFDARRSATSREYRYRIDVGPVPDPFVARYVWHRAGRLDAPAMRRAAGHLVGEHDFRAFCRAPEPPAGTVRRLERLVVAARGERIEVLVRANAFCQQMVRSLVGTLVRVGDGTVDPEAIPAIIAGGDRAAAGRVAPPHGLTLWQVRYGRRSVRALTPQETRR